MFYKLRNLFGISEESYIKSLGPNQLINSIMSNDKNTLYELCSSGQSGSLFYYTKDKKYLMKTIPLREFEKFSAVLPAYYHHLRANRDSLISRFFGLHEVVWVDSDGKQQRLFLVILNNLFTDFAVGMKFDLKGSTHGRDQLRANQSINDLTPKELKTALKCNDFRNHMRQVKLDEKLFDHSKEFTSKRRFFHEIIKSDVDFLIAAEIIDYSLLVGEIIDVDYQTLRSMIEEVPSLGNGIYFEPGRQKAYIIGIIDPLTGFT